jgi:hypothetical protein
MSNARIIAADAIFHVEETFKDWERAVMNVRACPPRLIKLVELVDDSEGKVNVRLKKALEKQDAAKAELTTAIEDAKKSLPAAARCIVGQSQALWQTDLSELLGTLRAEIDTQGENAANDYIVRDILTRLHTEQRRLRCMPEDQGEVGKELGTSIGKLPDGKGPHPAVLKPPTYLHYKNTYVELQPLHWKVLRHMSNKERDRKENFVKRVWRVSVEENTIRQTLSKLNSRLLELKLRPPIQFHYRQGYITKDS